MIRFHEILGVANLGFLGNPETHSLAIVVGPGHGIREYVIEKLNGLRAEHVKPFSSLSLHGEISARWPFVVLYESSEGIVRFKTHFQSAIVGNAVGKSITIGVCKSLLSG